MHAHVHTITHTQSHTVTGKQSHTRMLVPSWRFVPHCSEVALEAPLPTVSGHSDTVPQHPGEGGRGAFRVREVRVGTAAGVGSSQAPREGAMGSRARGSGKQEGEGAVSSLGRSIH